VKDISVSFATTALIQVLNIATGLLAARLLLPEGRGELAAIMLWPGIIAELGIIGLSDALLFRAATRAADPRELFGATAILTFALSLVLIAIGLVALPYALADETADARLIGLVYLCAYLPTYLAALFLATIFQGHLDMMTWNAVRVLVPIGYLVAIMVAVALGYSSVAGFAAANIAAHVISVAAGLLFVARAGWIGFSARWQTIWGLLVYGVKVHVGEVLNTLRQRLDQALVALYLPAHDLGIYVVALTVANGSQILITTIANVAFPKITSQGTYDGRVLVLGRYLRLSIAVALATCAGLYAVSAWLVPLLFGQPFAPSVPVVFILLLAMVPLAAKYMFSQGLKAFDRPLAISRAEFAGLVVAAVALLVLLPRFGIAGAAWSLVLAQVTSAAVMGFTLHHHIHIHISELLRPTADDWTQAQRLLRYAWPAR
jgi:O-antigen/teichoic acid export membrane protein